MGPHVLTLVVEFRLPASDSKKAKRSVVTSLAERARQRFRVAVAETAHQEDHQRAQLAAVAVSGSPGHCTDVIDDVERLWWSEPSVEVVDVERVWTEFDR